MELTNTFEEEQENLFDSYNVLDEDARPDRLSAICMALRCLGVSTEILDKLVEELNNKHKIAGFAPQEWKGYMSVANGFTGVRTGLVTADPDNFSNILRQARKALPELQGEDSVLATLRRAKVHHEIFVDLRSGTVLVKADVGTSAALYNPAGDISACSEGFGNLVSVTATPYKTMSMVKDFVPKFALASYLMQVMSPNDKLILGKAHTGLALLADDINKYQNATSLGFTKNFDLVRNPLPKDVSPKAHVLNLDERLASKKNLFPQFVELVRGAKVTQNLIAACDKLKTVLTSLQPIPDPEGKRSVLYAAPAGGPQEFWNAIALLRVFRDKAANATKMGAAIGGAHHAEVIRKQLVPMRFLGFIDDQSLYGTKYVGSTEWEMGHIIRDNKYVVPVVSGAIDSAAFYEHFKAYNREPIPYGADVKRYLVGCGDSNIVRVQGIKGIFMDINDIPDVPDVRVKNALEYEWLPDDIVFSDVFVKDPVARVYWKTVNQAAYADAKAESGVKAQTSLTAFERTFCMIDWLVRRKVREFCAKLILEPCNAFTAFVEAAKGYKLMWFPGGRGHNGEVYVHFRMLEEGEEAEEFTELTMQTIVRQYLGVALASAVSRLVCALTFKVDLPPLSNLMMPVTFDKDGRRHKVVTKTTWVDVWPTVKVKPTLGVAFKTTDIEDEGVAEGFGGKIEADVEGEGQEVGEYPPLPPAQPQPVVGAPPTPVVIEQDIVQVFADED
jgi:hypothetical protein